MLMPASEDATGLPPIMYTCRPKIVFRRTKNVMIATTTHITIDTGTPRMLDGPRKLSVPLEIGLAPPHLTIEAAPRPMPAGASVTTIRVTPRPPLAQPLDR